MCGRYTLTDPDPRRLRARFALDESIEIEAEPRYNVAPTDPVLAVRLTKEGQRDLGRLRWGLVPYWAREGWKGPPMINARAERIDDVPVFREALERRRCLIPADGFYEWRADETGKQPIWVSLPESELFAFAGLWSRTKRDDDTVLRSCTIVTCDPNEMLRSIHDRMPVILPREVEETWLDPEREPDELKRLLRPYEAELELREVGEAVNDVKNDGPDLLEPPLKLL
jgi:putative SOS response-associated peptidase YedK